MNSNRLLLFLVPLAAAFTALSASFGAALPARARYAGQTGDGHVVQLRLTSDANQIASMRIDYTVVCNNPDFGGETYTRIFNVRVRADNTFSGAGTYTGSVDGSKNDFAVAGRVSGRSAHGTFSLKSTSPDDPSLRCKTGTVHWRAHRTAGKVGRLRLNLLVDPGHVVASGVKLDHIRVQRKRRGHSLLGPSPRGARIYVRCTRGCRSRTLALGGNRREISYLERHPLPRGARFVVRVTRNRPA